MRGWREAGTESGLDGMAAARAGDRHTIDCPLPMPHGKGGDSSWPDLEVVALACAAFVLAALGIASRMPHALATFWPANAVVLGAFLLRAHLARPLNWLLVFAVVVAADLLVARTHVLASTVIHSIGFAGIAAGYLAFRRIFGSKVDFGDPSVMPRLCLVALVGAATQGLLGGAFTTLVSQQSAVAAAMQWFSGGFLAYITLLPAVLSSPTFFRGGRHGRRWRVGLRRALHAWLPGALLVVSLALSLIVGGGGAIAFPVIALSYCALRYSVFTTSVLVVAFTVWTTRMAATGMMPEFFGLTNTDGLVSLRLAIASIALAPLIIASVMAAHARTLAQWRFAADSDSLTAVLNPRGFYREARVLLRRRHVSGLPVAVLMLDLDFFKQVNDTYGHSAGDGALVAASDLLRRSLREGDVCGRLGGEEFAVLLAQSSIEQASAAAERIRASIEECAVPVHSGELIRLTASIGVSFAAPAPRDLRALLRCADLALYEAKRSGRNQVCARCV